MNRDDVVELCAQLADQHDLSGDTGNYIRARSKAALASLSEAQPEEGLVGELRDLTRNHDEALERAISDACLRLRQIGTVKDQRLAEAMEAALKGDSK